MASRYVIPAVVLAIVAGGIGFWVAKDDIVTTAIAEATATDPAVPAPRVATAANPKVADVGGEMILKSDVEQLYNAIKQRAGAQAPAQDEVFWMLVDQIVASRLIIQAATKDNLQSTAEVQAAVKMATEQIVQEAYVQSLFKGLDTDANLKPLYDQMVESMKGQQEIRARHILVADEAKAVELIKKINDGAKFEDVAKAESIDTGSGANGGDLDYFSKDAMVPEFGTVAFALSDGQMTQTPVKTQFGYHIIKVEGRRAVTPPKFEDVKPQLVARAQQEKLQSVISTLRAQGNVKLVAAEGVPALPPDQLLQNMVAPSAAGEATPAPAQ